MTLRNQFIAPRALILLLVAALACGADAGAGEDEMARFGCYSCHRTAEKLIGPAFREVSRKYKSQMDAELYLFRKIREGGEGVWGDIPMVANTAEKISDKDLRDMIAWIRSL